MRLKIKNKRVDITDAQLKQLNYSRPMQDIYIFVGSAIPGIKEVFTACGYNPDRPTKESIALIKKEHKVLRNVCKTLVLSAQYGAGPNKICETLKLQGISKPIEEVIEIHKAYWNLYAGIREYERFLRKMWTKNKGWVLNGLGRPICVDEMYIKDIVNRVIQSTGHDLHMLGLHILRPLLEQSGANYRWVIADFHDEAILEVPDGQQDVVVNCFREMEKQINNLLQPLVPLKLDPAVGTCLADFKIEG